MIKQKKVEIVKIVDTDVKLPIVDLYNSFAFETDVNFQPSSQYLLSGMGNYIKHLRNITEIVKYIQSPTEEVLKDDEYGFTRSIRDCKDELTKKLKKNKKYEKLDTNQVIKLVYLDYLQSNYYKRLNEEFDQISEIKHLKEEIRKLKYIISLEIIYKETDWNETIKKYYTEEEWESIKNSDNDNTAYEKMLLETIRHKDELYYMENKITKEFDDFKKKEETYLHEKAMGLTPMQINGMLINAVVNYVKGKKFNDEYSINLYNTSYSWFNKIARDVGKEFVFYFYEKVYPIHVFYEYFIENAKKLLGNIVQSIPMLQEDLILYYEQVLTPENQPNKLYVGGKPMNIKKFFEHYEDSENPSNYPHNKIDFKIKKHNRNMTMSENESKAIIKFVTDNKFESIDIVGYGEELGQTIYDKLKEIATVNLIDKVTSDNFVDYVKEFNPKVRINKKLIIIDPYYESMTVYSTANNTITQNIDELSKFGILLLRVEKNYNLFTSHTLYEDEFLNEKIIVKFPVYKNKVTSSQLLKLQNIYDPSFNQNKTYYTSIYMYNDYGKYQHKITVNYRTYSFENLSDLEKENKRQENLLKIYETKIHDLEEKVKSIPNEEQLKNYYQYQKISVIMDDIYNYENILYDAEDKQAEEENTEVINENLNENQQEQTEINENIKMNENEEIKIEEVNI